MGRYNLDEGYVTGCRAKLFDILYAEPAQPLQVDRNEDMLRSCLRAVDAVSRIPGTATCAAWRTFLQKEILGPPPMRARYNAVKEERQEAEGLDLSTEG